MLVVFGSDRGNGLIQSSSAAEHALIPTIGDVLEGRDVQLEKAIEVSLDD